MRTILPHAKNPALRRKAGAVSLADITTPHIKSLIADMKRLLAKEEFGVALAASQIGEPLQLFIVSGRALARDSRNAPDSHRESTSDSESQSFRAPDSHRESTSDSESQSFRAPDEPERKEEKPALPDEVYINPKLIKLSRAKKEKHEGCLSIRGKWGLVPRAEKATIQAYDEHGKKVTRGASGFLAHIFQHEMDHLEGILYTDKATEVYDEKETKEE